MNAPIYSRQLCLKLCWVVVLTELCGCGTSRKAQLERVAKNWCQTIRASQVIPVYPLTEDLQPGDLFLVQRTVADQHRAYEEKGFLALDHHVDRLNPTRYEEFYRNSFKVGTSKTPVPDTWLKAGSPSPWQDAPEAAFPSYTFSTSRSGGLNLAVPASGIPVGLSLLGARTATGSVFLSKATTYGIDTVSLFKDVGSWAGRERESLADIAAENRGPRFLRVISRVYLVGEIDVTLQDARGFGGGLAAGASRPVEIAVAKPGDSATAHMEGYRKNLNSLNDALKEATEGDNGFAPGGSLKIAAASARSITLKQSFARPLVIGYVGFDMRIGRGGVLGPPIATFTVVTYQEEPGHGDFFGVAESLYIDSLECIRDRNNEFYAAVLDELDSSIARRYRSDSVADDQQKSFRRFKMMLSNWRRTQREDAGGNDLLGRIVQAIRVVKTRSRAGSGR